MKKSTKKGAEEGKEGEKQERTTTSTLLLFFLLRLLFLCPLETKKSFEIAVTEGERERRKQKKWVPKEEGSFLGESERGEKER